MPVFFSGWALDSLTADKDGAKDSPQIIDILLAVNSSIPEVMNHSDTQLKIKFFMSLFKGREDVYATRWENKNRAGSGYSPVCLNQ